MLPLVAPSLIEVSIEPHFRVVAGSGRRSKVQIVRVVFRFEPRCKGSKDGERVGAAGLSGLFRPFAEKVFKRCLGLCLFHSVTCWRRARSVAAQSGRSVREARRRQGCRRDPCRKRGVCSSRLVKRVRRSKHSSGSSQISAATSQCANCFDQPQNSACCAGRRAPVRVDPRRHPHVVSARQKRLHLRSWRHALMRAFAEKFASFERRRPSKGCLKTGRALPRPKDAI